MSLSKKKYLTIMYPNNSQKKRIFENTSCRKEIKNTEESVTNYIIGTDTEEDNLVTLGFEKRDTSYNLNMMLFSLDDGIEYGSFLVQITKA